MSKQCKLLYGEQRRPVTATLCNSDNIDDAYFSEAIFEDSGEYLQEHELLLLETYLLDTLLEVYYE